MAKALKSLDQLKPAPYNPREIAPEAMEGLRASLGAFGDISGIVWNKRSGHLVCGHQRVMALRLKHGNGLKLDNGALVNQDGERFMVRVVDWDDPTEKAANVAANNPHIAGDYTPELGPLLEELKIELPDLSASLRLGEIGVGKIDFTPQGEDTPPRLDEKTPIKCPECGHEFTT